MANDKYYGYSPKKEEIPSRLEKYNPYEFRKGMDYELTEIGVSRLVESTPEEREKATEAVLKKLEEHSGYYSALIHYETEYRNMENKPAFKTWLKEFYEENNMKEVDKTFKNDKMEKLKEAIKTEVKNILIEAKDDDKEEKTASKAAKGKAKGMKALDKEEEKLRDQKKKLQDKIFPLIQDFKNGKINKEKYTKKIGSVLRKGGAEFEAGFIGLDYLNNLGKGMKPDTAFQTALSNASLGLYEGGKRKQWTDFEEAGKELGFNPQNFREIKGVLDLEKMLK